MEKDKSMPGNDYNVFADIGLAYPEKILARAEVLFAVTQTIKKHELTQKEVAVILGISQPKVSCLMHGKLSMFSMDQLLRFLNKLGKSVNIVINPEVDNNKASTSVIQNKVAFSQKNNRLMGWKRCNLTFSRLMYQRRIRSDIAEIISPLPDRYIAVPIKTNGLNKMESFTFIKGVIQ